LAASRYSCIYWVDHLLDWNYESANHRVDLQDGVLGYFTANTGWYLYALAANSIETYEGDSKVKLLLRSNLFQANQVEHLEISIKRITLLKL